MNFNHLIQNLKRATENFEKEHKYWNVKLESAKVHGFSSLSVLDHIDLIQFWVMCFRSILFPWHRDKIQQRSDQQKDQAT